MILNQQLIIMMVRLNFFFQLRFIFIFIGLYNENFMEDRLHNKRNVNPSSSLSSTLSEPSHVRKIIDRLESSSSSSSDRKQEKKISIKKSLHDDHSDGSTSLTSSPPVKRVARRNYNEKNLINGTSTNHEEDFNSRQNGLHDEISFRNKSNEIKFELNREEIINGPQRTTSGTTVSLCFKRRLFDLY